jgi:hypothetical protein
MKEQTMSTIPKYRSAKPEIDDETRRIIEQRLATADHEPKQDARDAIEEIRRKIKQPVPR